MEHMSKPMIPDDVVQYSIYFKDTSNVSNEKDLKNTLLDYLQKCLALVCHETHNYIWQNESFNLQLVEDVSLPHLRGCTNFGDSIDDEWLIVYLLKKITQTYSNLIACAHDTDGQFLLIEIAELIPKWLTPDTCKNRVFILGGEMHLLLKPSNPGNMVYCPIVSPDIEQALHIVASYPSETTASSSIATCFNNRVDFFSKKLLENVQFSNVFIPKNLVYILDRRPNFISKCVQAFYLRDPIDLRVCRTFKFMDPGQRIWTQIPMSRCHYAQLMHQNFSPDLRSGYKSVGNLSVSEEKGWDLGMKIAHGCEIFCSRQKSTLNESNLQTVFEERKFFEFIKSLTSLGFFGNEIEGSKRYQQLFNESKEYYIKCLDSKRDENQSLFSNSEVLHLLNTLNTCDEFPNLEKLKMESSISALPTESKDDWMYLNEEDIQQLEEKMNKGFSSMYSRKKTVNVGESAHEIRDDEESQKCKQDQLEETVKRLNEFVDEVSDYTGIEVEEKSSISFSAKDFVTSLEKLLDVNYMENRNNSNQFSDGESDDFLNSDDQNSTIGDSNFDRDELNEYMECMDEELSGTAVGQSFVKLKDVVSEVNDLSISDKVECNETKVDIDANLLENFMLGKSEERTSGPITNILGSVQVDLPLDD